MKQITFTHNGVSYTLEYTRDTIRQMERQGFSIQDFERKPMTILPQMFAGAFLAHHKSVSADVIDSIFKKMPDKSKLLEKLGEMYSEPLQTLLSEPEDNEGKVEWDANW